MFSRLSQLARHFSRPLPNYAHRSARAAPAHLTQHRATPSSTQSLATSGGLSAPQSSSPQFPAAAMAAEGRRLIHTAGCIIIGDEVLGGKTVDTNSAYFAKFCFALGINLKRVEVIPDDEADIVEAARRMSSNYDLVVTSGGIGPTHDDITYASIAKAFGLPLKLHHAAFERMRKLSRPHPGQPNFDWDAPSAALTAKKRMVEVPYDEKKADEEQVIFVNEAMWVPVSCVNGNIHILPGVPRLFEALLEGLKPMIQSRVADPEGGGVYRILISTPMPESAVAPVLTDIAAKVEAKGVKIGSYPRWGKSRNTVTLVGTDREFMDGLAPEVVKAVQGRRVTVEGEDDDEGSDKDA